MGRPKKTTRKTEAREEREMTERELRELSGGATRQNSTVTKPPPKPTDATPY